MNLHQEKNLWIVTISLVILLISNVGYSADICFPEPSANKMLMELERGRLDTQELGITKKLYTEKETQYNFCQDQIKVKNDELKICSDGMTKFEDLRKKDKKACDEAISNAKPSLKDIILYTGTILGVGLLLGLLL